MSYSAWLADTARKEFTIRAGLNAVSSYENEHGNSPPASWPRPMSGPRGPSTGTATIPPRQAPERMMGITYDAPPASPSTR